LCYIGDWKRAEIRAGSKIHINIPVSLESIKATSHLLTWKIISEQYDIGFEISFTPIDSSQMNPEIVREVRQIDSHLEPVEGSWVCCEAGTYRVTLDNSHSRFRNKTVIYRVGLTQIPGPINPEAPQQLP